MREGGDPSCLRHQLKGENIIRQGNGPPLGDEKDQPLREKRARGQSERRRAGRKPREDAEASESTAVTRDKWVMEGKATLAETTWENIYLHRSGNKRGKMWPLHDRSNTKATRVATAVFVKRWRQLCSVHPERAGRPGALTSTGSYLLSSAEDRARHK